MGDGLEKCAANYVALTPLHFAERAARVFPDRAAVIYGDAVHSWAQTYRRCTLLASALRSKSIAPGDTVTIPPSSLTSFDA
jgi:fatty-acyl-CoA synthase